MSDEQIPRNWRRDPIAVSLGFPPKPVWERDSEGRTTLWEAEVSLHEGAHWAQVWRIPCGRRGPMHASKDRASGQWQIGPFSTPERAIAFTERWIELRRDPQTWRGDRSPFAPGDSYTVAVLNEEAAAAWPQRADGIEVQR